MSFLTGVGRIERRLRRRSLDGTETRRCDLVLGPRSDEAEIGRLRLTVDAETYDIAAAEIRDPLGNVPSSVHRPAPQRRLDDALFQFEVPAGVDVIEAPIGD